SIADNEKLDGVLLHHPRYDEKGVLVLDSLLGSNEQKAAVETLLGEQLPEVVLAPAERKLSKRWEVHFARPLDWARLVGKVRARFRDKEDLLARRTYLERAWYSYAEDQVKPHLNWRGLYLHSDDDPETKPEPEARIAGRLQGIVKDVPGL